MGSVIMAATPMRAMQSGEISFSSSLGTVNVVFATPMPSAAYKVFCAMKSGGSLSFVTISNQTANGFTAQMGVSVSAVLLYIALQDL